MSRTNRYEEPAAASREDLESAVATGDPTAISRTMVGVIEDDDVDWLTDTLLDLAGHESLEVRATAVTCLGHVARIHGHIDSDRVLSRLRHLRSERPLRGRVDDAIDDIKHFAVHRSHALVTELVNDPRRRPASRRDSLPVPVQLVSGHRAPTTGQERDRVPVARGVRRARSKASEPPTCLGDLARRGSLGCQARSRRDRAGLFPRERQTGDGSPVGGRPVRVSNATVAQQYPALCTPDDGFASWNVSMEGHHASVTSDAVNAVLEDLEETFEDEGILPLYQVGWSMSGHVPRTDPSFDAECRAAFDAFRARHPELVLASMRWPLDLSQAHLADPDVKIELDLDPEAPADIELLVLMGLTDIQR